MVYGLYCGWLDLIVVSFGSCLMFGRCFTLDEVDLFAFDFAALVCLLFLLTCVFYCCFDFVCGFE